MEIVRFLTEAAIQYGLCWEEAPFNMMGLCSADSEVMGPGQLYTYNMNINMGEEHYLDFAKTRNSG